VQDDDDVLELDRTDFLNHKIITSMGNHYTVENVLRVAAHSLGGVHLSDENHDARSQQLREYMEGSTWMGRTVPSAIVFEMGWCTLRACQPLAQELGRLGLYSPAPSPFHWAADGTVRFTMGSGGPEPI
jgi:hypothetical protein